MNNLERCKNCKYFKRNTEKYHSNKYGECTCNKFEYGSTYIYDSEDEKRVETETDKLFYEDYENYNADFEVGENFGCVHFRRKE